jgi:GNAT superfamily N-acetyltransferase
VLESVTFRPLDPSELPLVLDSWFRSWRVSEYSGTTPNHLAASVVRELVGGLIARGAQITVADFNGRVLGWLCWEAKGDDTILHLGYVKDPYRRQGIGRALVEYALDDRTGKVFYTHKTRLGRWVLPKHATWAPEIARRRDL